MPFFSETNAKVQIPLFPMASILSPVIPLPQESYENHSMCMGLDPQAQYKDWKMKAAGGEMISLGC